MRLNASRVQPLPELQRDEETRELLERMRRAGRVYNIFAVPLAERIPGSVAIINLHYS